MLLHHRIQINLPPGEVWKILTDPAFMIFWQEGYESTVMIKGDPSEAGSVASHVFAEGKKKTSVTEEILVLDPMHRKESRLQYPTMTQKITYQLDGDQNTVVDCRVDVKMSAFSFRILAPWIRGSFQKKLEDDLHRLKERMEGLVLEE